MNGKWFLRGLGLGIVVTALLLCIIYRNVENNKSIIREAKELGMVFPEDETASVEKDAEQFVAQGTQQVQDEATEVSETAVEAQEETKESKKDKEAKEKIEKSKKDMKEVSTYHGKEQTFVVRNGLLSSSVSREMEEAGIIEDSKDFDKYLEKKGYGKMVRSGKYKIPQGADYETIAKIITRQN